MLTNRNERGGSVSFSPDGTQLAAGWWNGRLDLWDVSNRRFLRSLTVAPGAYRALAVFSPTGRSLAAVTGLGEVTLFNLDSGQEKILWRATGQRPRNVRSLAFTNDGAEVIIYAGGSPIGQEVCLIDIATSKERSCKAVRSPPGFGAVAISPDKRRLYLSSSDLSDNSYSLTAIDLATGQEQWRTRPERDLGMTALDISPDGRFLASGSGNEDPAIRIWDAASGRALQKLEGHTSYVRHLVFTKDGKRMISAATDQSIRIWDTGSWSEILALRGHVDEVEAVATTETTRLLASVGKDGRLMLWRDDHRTAQDGYTRLSENPAQADGEVLDGPRFLLRQGGKPPQLFDLSTAQLPEVLFGGAQLTNLLGSFSGNMFAFWSSQGQILLQELGPSGFTRVAAVSIGADAPPAPLAYNVNQRLLARTASSNIIVIEHLPAPGKKTFLRCDEAPPVWMQFSEDGRFLLAAITSASLGRVWEVGTGGLVLSLDETMTDARFVQPGKTLAILMPKGLNHEVAFFDLSNPSRAPRRILGKDVSKALAVSPDGSLVASSTYGGLVRLFDPVKGDLIESLHGHLNAAFGIAFSPDSRRLISAFGGREAIKLWDIETRQELLTLSGIGSALTSAKWSSDGSVILAGPPWQAWRAPTWKEIKAAEQAEIQVPNLVAER